MHAWTDFQWTLYYLTQWLTALAYYVIPLSSYLIARSLKLAGIEYVPKPLADDILFRIFVAACGTHHLTHPVFMQRDMFWSMIIVDSTMAIVSSFAAIRSCLSASRG